jgi:hypothetical protein
MSALYRIRPKDKKSVEAFYDVYRTNSEGNIRGWSVTETYRWGQGFVEDESELPYSDDREHTVDAQIGWGCDLEDLCHCNFEFDDTFTDEEKREIETSWYESGASWLFDGDHDWIVDCDSVTILGPFIVDKVDPEKYGVDGVPVELKLKPKVSTTNWPFA